MKLAIISHTEHYKTTEGTLVGWSPTVNEINHLLELFDEIYHIAMLYAGEAPKSASPYKNDRVKFIALKPSGGQSLLSKFNTIINSPGVIKTVSKTLKKVDCFQLRTPTGIGVYLIPYLTLFTKKKGWFKYAGNWNQKNPPLGYRLQRTMLKCQSRKVTINGSWEKQPKHCLTFENPCLTNENLRLGEHVTNKKEFSDKLTFCYVGRLEKEKGVERIIKAFTSLSKAQKQKVKKVHLVGNGDDLDYFKELSQSSGVTFEFHGFLAQEAVFTIYKEAHFFLMPTTASEGFPKVIAEAVNFGCIPVVSNVSAIGQYIKHNQNGFVLNKVSTLNVSKYIIECLELSIQDHKMMRNARHQLVKKFTFQYYNKRIKEEIIS